jgi:hypothetical protein
MKTRILSIAAILLTVLSINTKTFATVKDDANVTTMLTNISKINQIEVHGNVELYVTSGDNDKVKVYNNYYNQNALVQQQNGILRISSYKAEKLVVWVTGSELRSLSAYDNASVKSFGKVSGIDLDITLNNSATATLDLDCFNAKIQVNDSAKANFTGSAMQSNMVVSHSATVNVARFDAAQNIQKRVLPAVVPAKTLLDELVAFN